MILGYEKVKILLLQGAIPDFRQLADDIGRTNLAADMGMNPKTLRRRVADPGEWTIAELAKLSDLLGVEYKVLLEMAHNAIAPRKRMKR
jgi:hypothetical protein